MAAKASVFEAIRTKPTPLHWLVLKSKKRRVQLKLNQEEEEKGEEKPIKILASTIVP